MAKVMAKVSIPISGKSLIRPRYGGTISDGLKRSSLVKHPKYGLAYVGGYMDKPTKKNSNRQVISLHCPKTGNRLTHSALREDLKFLTFNSWRTARQVASSFSSLG